MVRAPQRHPRHPGKVYFDGNEQGLGRFRPGRKMSVYFTNRDGKPRRPLHAQQRAGHIQSGEEGVPGISTLDHNGGTLQYRDGHLYLLGDGGGGCDFLHNAQDMSSKLGKLVRRDSNSWKIIGHGLRNPWRWSFDRLIGDTPSGTSGRTDRGEVDVLAPPRSAVCLRTTAGTFTREIVPEPAPTGPGTTQGELIFPKFDYPHDGPTSSAATSSGARTCRLARPLLLRRRLRRLGQDRRRKNAFNNRKTLGFAVPEVVRGELERQSLRGRTGRLGLQAGRQLSPAT